MKFPNPMKPEWLFFLLLALAGTPAWADAGDTVFGPAMGKLAQFSAEERRAMRERWEQASPEERLRMRREFQERVRQIPQDTRRELAEQWRNPPPAERERLRGKRDGNRPRGEYVEEGSFGMGFEYRRHDGDSVEAGYPPPNNFSNPGDFFERRSNRDGKRQRND